MEPPRGLWASLWNFVWFLPYFIGLLILGFIKGIIMFPGILLLMTVGISGIIVGLWPIHCFYTYYCIFRTKQFGTSLKLVLFIFAPAILIAWPPVGIACGVLGGAAYGLLSPMFATFQAVEEGKSDKFYHCFIDGTWDAVKGSFTIIRDVRDVCYHSYLSIMYDLRHLGPQEGKYYEIRLIYLPQALVAGILGSMIDFPVISVVAMFKSFYMLFKGWHRLFHDCIGREGPFLETICVPFAGLAILLWPLAVVGAVLGSMVSSIFLGAYAAVIVYQESSIWYGLCYIVASLSMYDEYSNDVLDMPEGSCFPRPQYRKNPPSRTTSRNNSISGTNSLKRPISRASSINSTMLDLKPIEIIDGWFEECQRFGEIMVSEGILTLQDIEYAKNNKDSDRVISIGLPAYCMFQFLLRSAKANSTGLLLKITSCKPMLLGIISESPEYIMSLYRDYFIDGVKKMVMHAGDDDTEIMPSNRPKDTYFDWFLNPLLIMKDQIKACNLTESEEEYLGKMVLFKGDPSRLKNSMTSPPPESELRRAELDALARRLQGITKSISRYPTCRRRYESSLKKILEELGKKNGDSGKSMSRSKSKLGKFVSMSFKSRTNNPGVDQEAQTTSERDLESDEQVRYQL